MSDVSRSEQSDRTRDKLLGAGLDLLRGSTSDRLFERLDAKRVSQHVGVTTGAFYYHFEGPDEYVAALLRYSLEKSPNPELLAAAGAFEGVLAEGGSFADSFMAAFTAVLEFADTDPTFSLMLAVASQARHDVTVRAILSKMYDLVQRETGEYYQLIVDLLDREFRPPFVLADLADAYLAVYEGLALRQNGVPGSVPNDRLGMMLMPITMLMTREKNDPDDAGAWIAANAPRFPSEPDLPILDIEA